MANFEKAYRNTMGHEGGYSADPVDFGGETYKGISRRYHPSWQGWELIDDCKGDLDFPKCLKRLGNLERYVHLFYKDHFWDKILGDEISSQLLAEEMFDNAVNMGISRSVKFLQTGLNVLNRKEKHYKNLVVDGRIGNNTLNALNTLLLVSKAEESYLYKVMNILQGQHYINLMGKSESQERFARGWLNRVDFVKI